jgi:hypothetical protein
MTDTPYQGLESYSEQDAARFFGREGERRTIMDNLRASRLTVLYGPSGVGKSSVLRAGVLPCLKQLSQDSPPKQGRPGLVAVYFNSWAGDPVTSLSACIEESAERFLQLSGPVLVAPPKDDPQESVETEKGLLGSLRRRAKAANVTFLIILDQFEDYFLYHSAAGGEGNFDYEFPLAVNQPMPEPEKPGRNADSPCANFLISIREESLAKLDRFEETISDIFGNCLRIDRLGRHAAKDAIKKPLDCWYNERFGQEGKNAGIEDTLVDAVLDGVKTGQFNLGESVAAKPPEATAGGAEDVRIEAPFLQLVMMRLWEEESATDKKQTTHKTENESVPGPPPPLKMKLSTLTRLGGAEQIIREYLDKTIASLSSEEQDDAEKIFHYLVTPSGTKIAHTVRNLAAYTALSDARIAPLLDKLASARVLCPVGFPGSPGADLQYQVFHDVLVPAIQHWRTMHTAKRAVREIKKTSSWSGVNLDFWIRGWAYEAAKRRATLYFRNMIPDEMLREMTRTKGPSSREEELSDWREAEIQLAYELFDSRVGLTQIEPEDYPRLEQCWFEDIKRIKAYHVWLDRGAGWSPERSVDNYMSACVIIHEWLKATPKPGTLMQFQTIANYIEKQYLTDGIVDDQRPIH